MPIQQEKALLAKFGGSELIDSEFLSLDPGKVLLFLQNIADLLPNYNRVGLVVGGGARARFAQELVRLLKSDQPHTVGDFLATIEKNKKINLDPAILELIAAHGLATTLDQYREGVEVALQILEDVGISLERSDLEQALMQEELDDATDAVGIIVTQLNAAELMAHGQIQAFFAEHGATIALSLLTTAESIEASAEKQAEFTVFAGAGEVVGQTTDAVAGEIAWAWIQAGMVVDTVITTNVPYVYTKDPKKFPPKTPGGAVAISSASIAALVEAGVLNLDPDSHTPGGHVVLDWLAAKLFDRVTTTSHDSRVVITRIGDGKAIRDFLLGKKALPSGTIIHNGTDQITYAP